MTRKIIRHMTEDEKVYDYSVRTCKILKEHARDLRDDPERLTTDFIYNQVKSLKRKNAL